MLLIILSIFMLFLIVGLGYYIYTTNNQPADTGLYSNTSVYNTTPAVSTPIISPPAAPTVSAPAVSAPIKTRFAVVDGKDFLCPSGYYYEGDGTQQACVKEGESGYVCPGGWSKVSGKPYCQYSPDTSGNDNASSGGTTGGGQPTPPINDQSSTTTTAPVSVPRSTVYIPTPRKIRKIYKDNPWREGIMWNDQLANNPAGWLNSEQVMDVYTTSEAQKDISNKYTVYGSAYSAANDVFKIYKLTTINNGVVNNPGFDDGPLGYVIKAEFAVRDGWPKGCVGKVSTPYDRQIIQLKPERTDCSGDGWTHEFIF